MNPDDERRERRDLFAAAAMIGMLSNGDHESATPKYVADYAVTFADALMIALDAPTEVSPEGVSQ